MGIVNVIVWLEVQNEDEALDVSEQVSELLDAHIVRRGVQLRGVTQERPEAACGLACDGTRRLEGTVDGAPQGEIYVTTAGNQRIGIAEFLRQGGTSLEGTIIKLEAGPGPSTSQSSSARAAG